MPNLTTPIPPQVTGETQADVKRLRAWCTGLIDELSYLLSHLDAGNVIEAGSVRAENINANHAKISNAQVGALSADKLTAGTVDTEKVRVSSDNNRLELSGSQIAISDNNHVRFLAAYDKSTGDFQFLLCNKLGDPTVSINSKGEAVFSGQVESSTIYASNFIGTDSQSYAEGDGGVFAQMDPMGIKIMQDKNGERLQKFGTSVAQDGTTYLVLGAGNGEDSHVINGVVYTNGTFKIEKNEAYANMGLVGYAPHITFWEGSEELWLSGSKVLLNGVNVLSALELLSNRVDALEQDKNKEEDKEEEGDQA